LSNRRRSDRSSGTGGLPVPGVRWLRVASVHPGDVDDTAPVGVAKRVPALLLPIRRLLGFRTHAAVEQPRRRFVDSSLIGQVEDELVERVDHRSRWLHANDLEVRLAAGQAEDRAVLAVAATKLVDDAEADEIPVEPDRRVEVGARADDPKRADTEVLGPAARRRHPSAPESRSAAI